MVRTDVALHTGLALFLIALATGYPSHTLSAVGNTWYVTSSSDSISDGDEATRSGSLRFVLAHTGSGDFVSFDDFDIGSAIWIASPLSVPAGVAVGHQRNEPLCGSHTTPLANIKGVTNTINPLINLGGGATLRNVNLGGGDVALRIAGDDAEVCGVGLGLEYDQGILPLPPHHAALIIDGARAVVRRNYINGPAIVTPLGSDSRIGDTPTGSGDGNLGIRNCSVTVQVGANLAAQRVTLRDPFPRLLSGMPGDGVAGGDDNPMHANNWAQTPQITRAETSDGFATVQIEGSASPNSLVDIYFDTQVTIVRAAQVTADSAGSFGYHGALPVRSALVFAVSTLNDPGFPGRVGSSSQFSVMVPVIEQNGSSTPTSTSTSTPTGTPTGTPTYTATATPTITPTYPPRNWMPLIVRP